MNLDWLGQIRDPLVATPTPDRRETAIGYALRLTQANGYHSPTAFLPKGNETQASVRGGSIRTLQTLTGMPLEWAERLAIGREPGGVRLLGHLLASKDVITDVHRVCPACVEDDGILDASWHLTCVTHCAKHGFALIGSCDACGKGLRLNRPGVGVCRCDEIVRGSGNACTPELQALMRALRSRLFADKKIAPSPNNLLHFSHLDLVSLLALIRAMHRHLTIQHERPVLERQISIDLMDTIARALCAFKDGLLSVQAALHQGSVVLPGGGPRGDAFNWYYDRKFDLRSIPSLSFIGDAIYSAVRGGSDRFVRMDQASQEEGPANHGLTYSQDTPLKKGGCSLDVQWVRLDEFAVKIGCSIEGLRRAVDARFVRGMTRSARVVAVHRDELPRIRPSKHVGLEVDSAAALLGVSPSLLKYLAKSRNMQKTHIPSTGGPFAIEDLERLRMTFLHYGSRAAWSRTSDSTKRERLGGLLRRLEEESDLPDLAGVPINYEEDEILSAQILEKTVTNLCSEAHARRQKGRHS